MQPLAHAARLTLALAIPGLVIPALANLSALPALAATTPTPARTDRPQRDPSAAALAAVCQRLTTGDNAYFGSAIVEQLEARLAAAEAGGADVERLVRLRAWLAGELSRLGKEQEALPLLERARLDAERELGSDWPLMPALLTSQALAHLQLAERENCQQDPNAERCIVPLAPGAVHSRPAHTLAAVAILRRLAVRTPEDDTVLWLLGLARGLAGEREAFAELPAQAFGQIAPLRRWPNRAHALGVDTVDHAGGAVMDDFDGDGHLDLISSSWHPCEPMHAFRADGHGGFEEVSARWGLDRQLGGLNLVHADYDGDGHLDLLVLRGAWLGAAGRIRNSLLRNDLAGSGRFLDVSAAAGLAAPAYPTQTAAWGDIDNDGDLDLYIGNEAAASATDPRRLFGMGGSVYPSQLLRNDGGSFTDIARAAGVSNDRFAKGVAWGDVDNDGDLDLYVSNIGPNRLYRNDTAGGKGPARFTDIAATAGVVAPVRESFATWFFDVDNDGDLDLLVADYASPVATVFAAYRGHATSNGHPILYRNDSDGDGIRFTDVSAAWGLARPLLPMGANFGDLDNDGWLDIYFGTGVPDPQALMPNVMYRNRDGQGFVDVTAAGFGHLQKGHGIAFGDLDGDGDQDLFQELGGAYPYDVAANALYENPGPADPDAHPAWVTLRLRGARANRFALGARIEVVVREADGDTRHIHAVVSSGGSFGGSSLQQEIGLGTAVRITTLEVRWPSSSPPFVAHDLAPGRVYEITEQPPALVARSAPFVPLRAGRASHSPGGSIP